MLKYFFLALLLSSQKLHASAVFNLISVPESKIDTLPPLRDLREEDIDTVETSFRQKKLMVKMKNGEAYTYTTRAWTPRDIGKFNKKVNAGVETLSMIYSQAEQLPAFPGGKTEWDKYITAYCKQHKDELRKAGSGILVVQFIVDVNGEVSDAQALDHLSSKLALLAADALNKGPNWLPALQNGRKVICYQNQIVKLAL